MRAPTKYRQDIHPYALLSTRVLPGASAAEAEAAASAACLVVAAHLVALAEIVGMKLELCTPQPLRPVGRVPRRVTRGRG